MAEAVFRDLVSQSQSSTPTRNPFGTIDSAGTGAYHALSPPDPRTLTTLKHHGIAGYDHAARKVRPQDFRDFDWMFAMDEENLEDLLEMRRKLLANAKGAGASGSAGRGTANSKASEVGAERDAVLRVGGGAGGEQPTEATLAKVVLFGSFGGKSDDEEVIDPYYGGKGGFDRAYEQVERFSRGFLKYIQDRGT